MFLQKKLLLAFSLLLLSSLAIFAQPNPEATLADRYFQDEDYQASLEIYERLHKRNSSELFALRITSCYEQLGDFDEATKFLDKTIKRNPNQAIYPVVKAALLEKTGEIKAADKLYTEVIRKKLKLEGDFIRIGSYLYQNGKLSIARRAYLQGRKKLKRDFAFANEIASIYTQEGSWTNASREYLNVYYANPSLLEKTKLDILNLVTPASEVAVEKALLAAVDHDQSDLGLRTVLFEYYVLAENFMEAFIQVKSIDRLFKEDGNRVYRFAETLRNNKKYELSNKAYDYLINRKGKNMPFYYRAHLEKAVNSEKKAFDQIPVDVAAIGQAVEDFEEMLDEFGRGVEYFDAIYRQARLRIFYLDELEKPLVDLKDIAGKAGLRRPLWAKAKILIADIYLMQKEYNKAKLAYTEVADNFRDAQLGNLANFKLGQLAYYKGDFKEAEARLGAIKDNTSSDISNDAIRLNLTIIDNTGLDSTTVALEAFAQAQLFVYQRNYDKAIVLLDSVRDTWPEHVLADDILWEKANIYLKQNDIDKTIAYCQRLLDNHGEDVLADDALYTKARLVDYSLKKPEEAEKLYMDFLLRFPGSLFSVEVRKRVRVLRELNKAG